MIDKFSEKIGQLAKELEDLSSRDFPVEVVRPGETIEAFGKTFYVGAKTIVTDKGFDVITDGGKEDFSIKIPLENNGEITVHVHLCALLGPKHPDSIKVSEKTKIYVILEPSDSDVLKLWAKRVKEQFNSIKETLKTLFPS